MFRKIESHGRSFHQSDCLISGLRSKFCDQYSVDDILSQGHFMILSVPVI